MDGSHLPVLIEKFIWCPSTRSNRFYHDGEFVEDFVGSLFIWLCRILCSFPENNLWYRASEACDRRVHEYPWSLIKTFSPQVSCLSSHILLSKVFFVVLSVSERSSAWVPLSPPRRIFRVFQKLTYFPTQQTALFQTSIYVYVFKTLLNDRSSVFFLLMLALNMRLGSWDRNPRIAS